jgi:hypothetical protein
MARAVKLLKGYLEKPKFMRDDEHLLARHMFRVKKNIQNNIVRLCARKLDQYKFEEMDWNIYSEKIFIMPIIGVVFY